MIRLLFGLMLLGLCGSNALAQSSNTDTFKKVEVFVGYSAIGEVRDDEEFNAGFAAERGIEVSVIRNFNKYFGIKGDFSFHPDTDKGRGTIVQPCAQPVCPTATQDFQFKTRLFNFLVGPEIKGRNRTRLTPFAHALFGVAHGRGTFTTSGTALNLNVTETDTGFAMALGGGLDVRVTKRFSVRASMDYNPAFITKTDAGSRDRRDNVRISLGILFH